MPRGRPTSSAHTNISGPWFGANFKTITNRQTNPAGTPIGNACLVSKVTYQTSTSTRTVLESDLITRIHPARPRPIRYVLQVVSQGLRGKADSPGKDANGKDLPPAEQELNIGVHQEHGGEILGFDVLQQDSTVSSIKIFIGGCTLEVTERKNGSDHVWSIELASNDAERCKEARNLLQHVKACCEHIPKHLLTYTNVERRAEEKTRIQTRLAVTTNNSIQASSLMVGREQWTFTGFYHRIVGLIHSILLESPGKQSLTATPAKKRNRMEWKKKKGKAKRQRKNERRAARRRAIEDDSEDEVMQQEPHQARGREVGSRYESLESDDELLIDPPRQQDTEDEEEIYEVEKLVGRRTKDGVIQYKVRWVGFSPRDDTWQSEEDLEGAQHLVTKYELARIASRR